VFSSHCIGSSRNVSCTAALRSPVNAPGFGGRPQRSAPGSWRSDRICAQLAKLREPGIGARLSPVGFSPDRMQLLGAFPEPAAPVYLAAAPTLLRRDMLPGKPALAETVGGRAALAWAAPVSGSTQPSPQSVIGCGAMAASCQASERLSSQSALSQGPDAHGCGSDHGRSGLHYLSAALI